MGERKKNWSTIREETKLNFLLQTKNSKKNLLAVKKKLSPEQKIYSFFEMHGQTIFFLLRKNGKKTAIKKLNFCLNSDFFRSCFLKSKMKKKNCKPQNHH